MVAWAACGVRCGWHVVISAACVRGAICCSVPHSHVPHSHGDREHHIAHPSAPRCCAQIRADLSALYIDAIKYKVELLHAIRTQRSSSAPVVP